MALEIHIDMHEIEEAARNMGAAIDQIPYAMANTLNDAAFNTRRVLVEQTWPESVNVFNRNFLSSVLRVEKATKANLSVSIVESRETTTPLKAHAEGGEKVAKSRFAVPMPSYREGKRTSQGLRRTARAREVIARTPKRALRITQRGIFVGESGKLRLIFTFRSRVRVPADVPFYRDFEDTMSADINAGLLPSLERAMATRHR